MRQFPHSQSHIRIENVSEISLQSKEKFSLEKDLEVPLELQYKHFFVNFIQAPLHQGRILKVLIFPPVFHSTECMAPFSVTAVSVTLCAPTWSGRFWYLFLPCVPFPS